MTCYLLLFIGCDYVRTKYLSICQWFPVNCNVIFNDVRRFSMNHLLIVEDNLEQLTFMEQTIRTQYPFWNIETASNYTDAAKLIKTSIEHNPFSLFMLDIQLSPSKKDIGGFLLAEEIRKNTTYYQTPILFLTAISDSGQYALSKFHCYDYITKPYTSEDILNILDQMLLTGYLHNSIEITDTHRVQHIIPYNNIHLIKANTHGIIIYDNISTYTTREYSLQSILEYLSSDFVRCHRKFVINLNYLKNIDIATNMIQIGNFHIPFGRTYASNLPIRQTKKGT